MLLVADAEGQCATHDEAELLVRDGCARGNDALGIELGHHGELEHSSPLTDASRTCSEIVIGTMSPRSATRSWRKPEPVASVRRRWSCSADPASGRTFDAVSIRLWDMDETGRLRLDAVARFLQDAATGRRGETGGARREISGDPRGRIEVLEPFVEDRASDVVTWGSSFSASRQEAVVARGRCRGFDRGRKPR